MAIFPLMANNFIPTPSVQNVLQTITPLPIHYWFGVYSSLLN
ncbi:hypothetical protein A2U01_0088801, partial [Trifolium medium]|nr:hypothetical protein [Trifolium medium]